MTTCDYCGGAGGSILTDMGDLVCSPCLIGRPSVAPGHGLTEYAQRGYLTYIRPDHTYAADMPGHYYIQGGYVLRRKVGGRNWSAFCSVESVHSFDLYDAEAEKFARDLAAIVARTRASN